MINIEKIVVVGGSGGIGSTIVRRYDHSQIVIGDIENPPNELLNERVDYIPVNVLDYNSIRSFVQEIKKKYNSVTHLISLAGYALPSEFGGLRGIDLEDIARSVNLNLTSHIYLLKEFQSLLEKDQSPNKTITLISSINALRDYGLPACSAAKAGLMGLVMATVGEFGREGIRINSVLPGTTPTPRTLIQPKNFDKLKDGTQLRRLTTPDEVANTVYALTQVMTAMTGQCIVVDCGQVTKT